MLKTKLVALSCVIGLLAIGSAVIVQASQAASNVSHVAGGITDYEAKLTGLSINLGPQSSPTVLATKTVPAGTYLVRGEIGVNTQPGSFIVCVVSNGTGNDGVFGTFTNQWGKAAEENVIEEETVTVTSGQSLTLACDDNQGKKNDTVGTAVLEAIPVNALK